MAFLPQPILPTRRAQAPERRVRIPSMAIQPGAISVSRRRRLFDLASAAAPTWTAPSPAAHTISQGVVGVDMHLNSHSVTQQHRSSVQLKLLERLEARENLIREDSKRKQNAWATEIEVIRKSQQPASAPPAAVQSASVAPVRPALTPTPPSAFQQVGFTPPPAPISYTPDTVSPPAPAPAADVETTPSVASKVASPPTPVAVPAETAPANVKTEISSPAVAVPEVDSPLPATSDRPVEVRFVPELYSPPVSQSETKSSAPAPNGSVAELYSPPRPKSESAVAMESVAELYSPPSAPAEKSSGLLDDVIQAVVHAAEEVIETAQDLFEDIVESTNVNVKAAEVPESDEKDGNTVQVDEEPVVPEPVKVESVADEPAAAKPEQEDAVSIGDVILDAIVDGVETTPVEKAPVDKSDVIQLVDSGKVKNLTVTKLRRLLSSNGLKTSGRKSELIARLTSFAKS